jgi:hypothetical protein
MSLSSSNLGVVCELWSHSRLVTVVPPTDDGEIEPTGTTRERQKPTSIKIGASSKYLRQSPFELALVIHRLRSPRSAPTSTSPSPQRIAYHHRSHALCSPQLRLHLFQTHRTMWRQSHRSRRATLRRGRDPAFRPRNVLLQYVSHSLFCQLTVIFPNN